MYQKYSVSNNKKIMSYRKYYTRKKSWQQKLPVSVKAFKMSDLKEKNFKVAIIKTFTELQERITKEVKGWWQCPIK